MQETKAQKGEMFAQHRPSNHRNTRAPSLSMLSLGFQPDEVRACLSSVTKRNRKHLRVACERFVPYLFSEKYSKRFHTKTQNRKEGGRAGDAPQASEMSRLHHLSRFTLGFLASKAKEGVFIEVDSFLFPNKRKHTHSCVGTIYFCWRETRGDTYWTSFSLSEHWTAFWTPSAFTVPKAHPFTVSLAPCPPGLAQCAAHSGCSVNAEG